MSNQVHQALKTECQLADVPMNHVADATISAYCRSLKDVQPEERKRLLQAMEKLSTFTEEKTDVTPIQDQAQATTQTQPDSL